MRAPDMPAAGADVGGGSVKYGVLAEGGRVVFRGSFPTSPTPEDTFEELRRRLREASASAGVEPRRLGVALPGPLPADRAALGELPNLPAWSGWPVRERLSALFGLPVAVENDANAAAFAEAHLGAGRGCRTVPTAHRRSGWRVTEWTTTVTGAQGLARPTRSFGAGW